MNEDRPANPSEITESPQEQLTCEFCGQQFDTLEEHLRHRATAHGDQVAAQELQAAEQVNESRPREARE